MCCVKPEHWSGVDKTCQNRQKFGRFF